MGVRRCLARQPRALYSPDGIERGVEALRGLQLKKSACVCCTHLLQQTQPLVGRYRNREEGHTTLHPPHLEMKGAQESRDTGAASLDKRDKSYCCEQVLVQLDGRRAVVCSFFPPATPQRTRQRGERGLQGGYKGATRGKGGHKGYTGERRGGERGRRSSTDRCPLTCLVHTSTRHRQTACAFSHAPLPPVFR